MKNPIFLPRTIGIELVRGCNFACKMCPVTSNATFEQKKFQFMGLALLSKLVAEIDRWPSIETIWYFHFGEPLAHPHYRKCLEILNQSSVAQRALVIQFTNASLITGEKAEAILDIPIIKKLVFSFDGFGDIESFERLRGPHFDQVLRNIREFSDRANRIRPDLKLATCTILPREGEVPDLRIPDRIEALRRLHHLFDPLGVQVEVRDMHNYSGNDQLAVSAKRPEHVFGGCPFVEQDSLYFTVNGWAQPCCAVYSETFNADKFPDQSFGQLLNNRTMTMIRHALRVEGRTDLLFCKNCNLSIGGSLTSMEFERFWKTRDRQGFVQDLAERRYLIGQLGSTTYPAVRLDLGCGSVKPDGFLGIDRYALSGVDIVADLSQGLPIANHSVDLILASHALEHVNNLQELMKEIYRVCRHGSQVCIVAPYSQQSLNLANPFHKQVFNEHSPRFWTNSRTTLVDPADYFHPHADGWGLAESDHSKAEMDFRCLRIEFFYFPEYRLLSAEKQREARKKYLDVCDQIMYHLLVVKQSMSEDDMKEIADRIDYYEPPYVTIRRHREQCESLEMKLEQVRHALDSREKELEQAQDKLQQTQDKLLEQEKGLDQIRRTLNNREAELEQAQDKLLKQGKELDQIRRTLNNREAELEQVKNKGKLIAYELDMFRHRKVTRWMNRILATSNAWHEISPTFQQLKDDSLIFTRGLKGYRLQPGVNLQRIPFVHYPLDLNRPNLAGILLAPIIDLPLTNGVIGIEIVSPSNSIVTQHVVPANQIDESVPTRFDFSPIRDSNRRGFRLRVFARDVDAPVRIFEWRKYGAFGLGPLKTKAFCGFLFQDSL